MALCPLPVRDPKDEKNRVVVPKEGQEPAFEKQEANSTASSVPPGPELKRKKILKTKKMELARHGIAE